MASPTLTALSVRELPDSALLAAQRALAVERRLVDAQSAVVAAEIGFRSRRELGSEGLAQKLGDRTAEKLVQRLTGGSARDAQTMVRVGSLDPESLLAQSVVAGTLGLDAANAIQSGIGDAVPNEVVVALIAEAADLSVEKLAARAREVRAEIDETGVADREQRLREQRFLRFSAVGDGMTRLHGLLDPESGACQMVCARGGAPD